MTRCWSLVMYPLRTVPFGLFAFALYSWKADRRGGTGHKNGPNQCDSEREKPESGYLQGGSPPTSGPGTGARQTFPLPA